MSAHTIAIVRTGIANIASVASACRRLGYQTELVSDPHSVATAPLLILPGVGTFAAGMDALREHALVEPLRERIASDLPTLAICLGLQLLCESSEESPDVPGLCAIYATVPRLCAISLRLPQFGWNAVDADVSCSTLTSGFAYYANSYAIREAPVGWSAAWSDYAGPFIAALERGSVVATQFHPELSGAYGMELITRWASRAKENATC